MERLQNYIEYIYYYLLSHLTQYVHLQCTELAMMTLYHLHLLCNFFSWLATREVVKGSCMIIITNHTVWHPAPVVQ